MKPTELLVYSIVALVLALLAVFIFQNLFVSSSVEEEIARSVNLAMLPSNLGNVVAFELPVKNGLEVSREVVVSKGLFDNTKISYAFECTDPNRCCPMGEFCSKSLEWTYANIRFKILDNSKLFSRCYEMDGLPVCRTYVGKKPAQAEINKIEQTQDSSKVYSIISLENSGELALVDGTLSLKLFKKVNNEWVDTEKVFPTQPVEFIDARKEHVVLQEIDLVTSGEYKIRFKFESLNAGFVEKDINFFVGENLGCKIDELVEIQSLPDGGFRELKHCSGCDYAFQCLAAWVEKEPNKEFFEYSKNAVYCLKDSYGGEC